MLHMSERSTPRTIALVDQRPVALPIPLPLPGAPRTDFSGSVALDSRGRPLQDLRISVTDLLGVQEDLRRPGSRYGRVGLLHVHKSRVELHRTDVGGEPSHADHES